MDTNYCGGSSVCCGEMLGAIGVEDGCGGCCWGAWVLSTAVEDNGGSGCCGWGLRHKGLLDGVGLVLQHCQEICGQPNLVGAR